MCKPLMSDMLSAFFRSVAEPGFFVGFGIVVFLFVHVFFAPVILLSMKKVCCKCNVELKPGMSYKWHPSYCKPCRQEYSRDYQSRRKDIQHEARKRSVAKNQEYVRSVKNQPCVDCGKNFHFAAMDFDHVRGKKLGCLSDLCYRVGLSRLKTEIRKCDLVCANCHRIRTYNRLLKH